MCWVIILLVVILLFWFFRHSCESYGRGGPLGDFLLTEGPPIWGTRDVPTGEGGFVYEDALP